MKVMRVLFVSDADAYYGAPKAMLEMVMAIRSKYDIDPVVFTSEKSVINEFCDAHSIENYVTYHRGFLFDEGEITPKYVIKNFLRFIRYKVDNIIGVKLAEKYVDFSKVDVIHSNSDRNDLGMELARKHNIKHILHIRECVRFHSFRRNYVEYINSNSDMCIVISECVKNEWRELGIKDEITRLVYDGIDLDNIVTKSNYDNEKLRLVCVGSLSISPKSPNRVIESLQYIPENIRDNIELDFIGEGEDEKKIKILAKKSPFKNIHFLGYRDDVCSLLCKYDVGIMSSSKDAFGRTTVEYGAAGLAVLASNRAANLELVDDGVNGLLYDYDDIEDLAHKIEALYYNKDLRMELGKQARKKAVEQYSKELNAENVYALYEELLG
jgi:glycosyltransferase involved in cell wall biosynthesis